MKTYKTYKRLSKRETFLKSTHFFFFGPTIYSVLTLSIIYILQNYKKVRKNDIFMTIMVKSIT